MRSSVLTLRERSCTFVATCPRCSTAAQRRSSACACWLTRGRRLQCALRRGEGCLLRQSVYNVPLLFIPCSKSSRMLRAFHGSVSRARRAEEHAQQVREEAPQRVGILRACVTSAGNPCLTS